MDFSGDLDNQVVDYVLKNGDGLAFTRHFWKQCEPLESDIVQYRKFADAQKLAYEGVDNLEIARQIGVSVGTVENWILLSRKPKLVHFLTAFLGLGEVPAGFAWLTLETSHGRAVPIGIFVKVPLAVQSWDDIEDVLEQLHPLPNLEVDLAKSYQFGFLLGMIIGDANKPQQGRGHRHIGLVLSKKYDTNLKIGDFCCQCAMSIGLRMHRVKDQAKRQDKPNEFYEWTSQSSPLIDWIFNIALGLEDGQLTTYDSVHADWALDAPRDFRLGLIQGLAESDGSVSISSQTVEFWVDPHRGLVEGLLAGFGIHGFRNRQAFSITKTQAVESFKVPVFSPHLKTVRYGRLELIASCRKLAKSERIPQEIREKIMELRKEGLSVPSIVEFIANYRKILVSFEAAQR